MPEPITSTNLRIKS